MVRTPVCSWPQLSATDISARAPMKGAAKRDSLCELQNSVNQWPPERALHSWDFLRVCLLQCLVWSTLFGSCFWEPSTFVNHWNREREGERENFFCNSSVFPMVCLYLNLWCSTSICALLFDAFISLWYKCYLAPSTSLCLLLLLCCWELLYAYVHHVYIMSIWLLSCTTHSMKSNKRTRWI